jgi:hypothetical protein
MDLMDLALCLAMGTGLNCNSSDDLITPKVYV